MRTLSLYAVGAGIGALIVTSFSTDVVKVILCFLIGLYVIMEIITRKAPR